jgi:DUF1680 family protein
MDPSSFDFATHTPDNYALLSLPEVYDHIVQENLLLCGDADGYLETGKPEMLRHLNSMCTDIIQRKMYLTSRVGNAMVDLCSHSHCIGSTREPV